MAIVNILFLSDLHFTRSDASLAVVLKECAKAYIEKMEELDDIWKPQIVAIAGDIGYRGAEDDYQFFTDVFFAPLLSILKINPDHVVACPGNHDKNDSCVPDREEKTWKITSEIEEHAKKYFFKWYRATCNEQRFILDDYAITPFQNYISFLINNGIKPFDTSEFDYDAVGNAKYLYGHRKIDGIDFYCYNSAWDCLHDDKQDKGNLRIGPVSRIIEEKPDKSFAISMVHHPQDWLSVENISSALFRREQIAYQKDIAFNGHMHNESFGWDKKCRVLNVQLPTWLSTDTDKRLWQSYIVRIDLEKMTYDLMSVFWRKNVDDHNIHPVTDIVSTSSDLRVSIKLEEERRKLEEEKNNNAEYLKFIFRMLMNNLDVMVSRPNIDILQNILELIQRIMEEAVKYALKTDKMMQFVKNAKTVMDDTAMNEFKYSKLSEEATILRSSLDIEDQPVLRYRKS